MQEVDKFRATTLQIAGFAFMTPLGNLAVNFLDFRKLVWDEISYCYVSISIVLVVIGIIFIGIGDLILRKSRN